MKLRLLFGLAVVVALAASCEDVRSYVYSARKYDATNACLNDYAAVEVVSGSGAEAYCPPTCFSVAGTIYVSTMCPPLPAAATALPADASPCSDALDAGAQEASCANAGGGGAQDASGEGGDDGGGEGGDDAGEDAPGDAPADVVEAG